MHDGMLLVASLALVPPLAHGVVVCDEGAAAEAGARILRAGGNAVDAAIATGFALAVVQPAAGNLGGGGFMLVRTQRGKELFLDYREVAPKAASRDMYLDAKGDLVPEASLRGLKAAAVPGSVAGLWEAHRRMGKLPWRALVQPAIDLAKGFKVSESLASALRGSRPNLERFPESRRVYLRNGDLPAAGETLRLPDLARTLERIRDRGRDGFYKGKTARLIDTDMRRRGGLITTADLAGYQAKARKPLHGNYRGHEIVTAPPPSSGGAVLLEMLNLLAPYKPKDEVERIHLMTETMRLAFADRAAYMGDPDFVRVPTDRLTSTGYADLLRRRIKPDQATPSSEVRPGLEAPKEGGHTLHYSVVDRNGDAVSVTTTLNFSFGSCDTVVGTGVLMNDEMDDFAAKPGTPNGFGLVQGEANAIAPGKRPLSSMTPTIVLEDGKPYLVVGSPGGPTIINTVYEVVTNVLDRGMDIRAAVAAPRFHHQWMPDELRVEKGLEPLAERLRAMGHKVVVVNAQGVANCASIDPKTSAVVGAPDGRRKAARAAVE